MSFVSVEFLLFCIATFFLYYCFPLKLRWIVLLIASLVFYWIFSGWLILYILITTFIIFGSGLWIQKYNDEFAQKRKQIEKSERKVLKAAYKKKKKVVVAIASVLIIGTLALLKYFNFVGSILNGIASAAGASSIVPIIDFVLPLGISYYSLMAVSYVVDVYRGTNKADKNYFRLLLFYFPHIVEGPFGRYHLLSNQLYNGNKFNYENAKKASLLILWGYFKKLVIADRCAIYVNEVFNYSDNYGGVTVIFAITLYTFEIYMDFSGCIDIVTGVSGLFGVKLSENFRRPFFSKSVDEFWRRWHITLGAFFRDYIFYPVSMTKAFAKIDGFCNKKLKGNIKSVIPLAYSLFFVWICNGLWHGASFKYIAYGMYYYLIMIVAQLCRPLSDKVLTKLHIQRESKGYSLFQILRTTIFVFIGMLIFRADSLSHAVKMLKTVVSGFSINVSSITAPMVSTGMNKISFIFIGILFLFILTIGVLQEKKGIVFTERIIALPIVAQWCVFIVAILSILILGIYGAGYDASSFIYGQF